MELVNETTQIVNENAVSCNGNTDPGTNPADLCNAEPGGVTQESEPQPDKPKTRLEVVREKLSKEQYLTMKAENKSDREICEQLFGKYLPAIMTTLKQEWGPLDVDLRKAPQPASQNEPKAEGIPAPDHLTIFQAINLHDELEEELESLNWLLDPEGKAPLVTSIRLLLDERRCQTATRLQRIRTAFTSQTVAI